MSSELPELAELTKQEKRRIQVREAQRRFYDKNLRKEKLAIPASYQVEAIRNYQKAYYQKNKEKLLQQGKERSKKVYLKKKTTSVVETDSTVFTLPPTL